MTFFYNTQKDKTAQMCNFYAKTKQRMLSYIFLSSFISMVLEDELWEAAACRGSGCALIMGLVV